MDYGPLLGGQAGVALSAVCSPRTFRSAPLKAGAARDHPGHQCRFRPWRGLQVGRPRGKNVTGYDLSKPLANSWGTLAAFTDVTFKVLPAAETEVTLAIRGR